MYTILEDLSSVTKFRVCRLFPTDYSQKSNLGTFTVTLNDDDKVVSPITSDDIDCYRGVYQNVIVRSTALASELLILQDYGVGEVDIDDLLKYEDSLIIPHAFLLDKDGSLGWYSGFLVWVAVKGDTLSITLLTEYQKFDINTLRQKRPFNIYLSSAKNFSYQSKVKFYIKLNFLEEENEITFDTNIELKDLFDSQNLYYVSEVGM